MCISWFDWQCSSPLWLNSQKRGALDRACSEDLDQYPLRMYEEQALCFQHISRCWYNPWASRRSTVLSCSLCALHWHLLNMSCFLLTGKHITQAAIRLCPCAVGGLHVCAYVFNVRYVSYVHVSIWQDRVGIIIVPMLLRGVMRSVWQFCYGPRFVVILCYWLSLGRVSL